MTLPITTVAEIKLLGGNTSSSSDPLLSSLLAQTLTAIGEFCNRTFPSNSFTEYRDGNGGTRMLMANYPLAGVSSVTINGVAVAQSTGFNSAGWSYNVGTRSLIMRGGVRFAQGQRNVVITGVAGFGDDAGLIPWPSDLKHAVQVIVLTRFNERTTYGINSKSLAGESVNYGDSASASSSSRKNPGFPAAARVVLANYQNTVPETGT